MRLAVLAAFLLLAIARTAAAVDPDEMLKDPALEARAQHVGQQLRCPVCKTESIEESDADLTRELRRIVRERITAGDSDQQILDYLHSRYGDFILLKPPFSSHWALWLGPPVILILGGGLAFVALRRRRAVEPDSLSDDERHAIEAMR